MISLYSSFKEQIQINYFGLLLIYSNSEEGFSVCFENKVRVLNDAEYRKEAFVDVKSIPHNINTYDGIMNQWHQKSIYNFINSKIINERD